MLTLFAIPKPFVGHVGIIQRNAIRSWARLPEFDILLLGDEAGTAEIADEVGAVHVSEVERNAFGTPYLSSCFSVAAAASKDELMAYVNADIILMGDFRRAVERVARLRRPFLMGGRRTDLDIAEPLTFGEEWEAALRACATREGRLIIPGGIDYFVFPRGLWPEIPPFAVGRWTWDTWLLYEAVCEGALLIDATPSVRAVHQSHGYEASKSLDGPEAGANLALHPDSAKWFGLNNAARVLYPWGLLPAWTRERLRQRLRTWLLLHPRALALYRALRFSLQKETIRPRPKHD